MKPIEHIDFKANGKPIIKGTRFSIAFMSIFLNDPEWTVERICEDYNLTPAQVYAAWSYYYDYKEEIDRSIEEAENFVRPDEAEHNAKIEAMKKRFEEKHGYPISARETETL